MPQTIDLINFPCGSDPSQWPKLSCAQPGQLALDDADLRLEANQEILFQDNGQIRAQDDNHRLVFNRTGGLLELHEAGDIRFLTGGPTPTEKLRIRADGPLSVTGDAEVLGHLFGAVKDPNGENLRMVVGRTAPDDTEWSLYTTQESSPWFGRSLMLKVDISSASLTSIQYIFTSIGGVTNHWLLSGSNSIYPFVDEVTGETDPNYFKIFLYYVHPDSARRDITPDFANERGKWHINWLAIGR